MTDPALGPDNWGSTKHISQGEGGGGGTVNNNNNNSINNNGSTVMIQPQRQPQTSKTTRKHRKRHAPVGPAGVWFDQQRQQQKGRNDSKQQQQQQQQDTERNDCDYDDEEEEEENDGGPGFPETQKPTKKDSDFSLSFSTNAWMHMQRELNLTIPSLPHFLSESERCSILRPYLPDEYMLLPELETMPSWKTRRKLLVVVETIQSLIDNLWTVRLTDETGASVVAWIQPKLVKDEQQLAQPTYIRPGYVWLLGENTTTTLLVLDSNSNCTTTQQLLQHEQQRHNHNQQAPAASGNVQLRRMLLVSQANILNVWTTSQAKEVSNEKCAQWIEKRQTLTSKAMEEFWKRHPTRDGRPSDCKEEEEEWEEEEEEEREWDIGRDDDNKKSVNEEASHSSSRDTALNAASSSSPKVGLTETNILQPNDTGGSELQGASDPNPGTLAGSRMLDRPQQQQQPSGQSAFLGSSTQRSQTTREGIPALPGGISALKSQTNNTDTVLNATSSSLPKGGLTETNVLQPNDTGGSELQGASDPNPGLAGSSMLDRPQQQQQLSGQSAFLGSSTQRSQTTREGMPALPGDSSALRSQSNNAERKSHPQQQGTSSQKPNFEFSKFALAAPSSATNSQTMTRKSPQRRSPLNNNHVAAEQVKDKQTHTHGPTAPAPVRPTVPSTAGGKEANTSAQSQQHRKEETATCIGDQNDYVVNKQGREEQERTGVESESKSKRSKLCSQDPSSQKAKKPKPACTNKSLSKVWTANSQNLFNMFDDDSDDNDGDDDVAVKSKKNKNDHAPPVAEEEQTDENSTNAVTDSTQPPPPKQQQKPSLFQASAFSGLDMEDLFDDDD